MLAALYASSVRGKTVGSGTTRQGCAPSSSRRTIMEPEQTQIRRSQTDSSNGWRLRGIGTPGGRRAKIDALQVGIAAYRPWCGRRRGSQMSYAGIRPKITGPGAPAADFRIDVPAAHRAPGLVNLFDIDSTRLTAALAIAEEASWAPDRPRALGAKCAGPGHGLPTRARTPLAHSPRPSSMGRVSVQRTLVPGYPRTGALSVTRWARMGAARLLGPRTGPSACRNGRRSWSLMWVC